MRDTPSPARLEMITIFPFKREPSAVLKDVKCGWVTTQHAQKAYGVIIKNDMIDKPATELFRKRNKSKASAVEDNIFYNVCSAQLEFEKIWTEKNYDALTEGLCTLPVSWRFFAKHQIFSIIDKMASDDPARSDGTAVKQALSELIERFPDLRATEDA